MSAFGTGAISQSMFGKNTTYRQERVGQKQGVAILAGKKASLLAMAKGKPAMQSTVRPQAEDVSRVMSEQTKETLRAASRMTNKLPYGTR